MATSSIIQHRLAKPFTLAFSAFLALAPFMPLIGQEADAPSEGKKEKNVPMVRLVSVGGLQEEKTFVIASKDEEGKWVELSEVKLRPTFISEWVKVAEGQLYIAERSGDSLVSRCAFTYPKNARRIVALMLPASTKDNFRAHVIDTAKEDFAAGKILLVNYSSTPGVVMLGTKRTNVLPGKSVVATPQVGDDGMFRLLVGYNDKAGKLVACYDRYIPRNDKSRDFLLLLPDPVLGLRVMTLAEFGPF